MHYDFMSRKKCEKRKKKSPNNERMRREWKNKEWMKTVEMQEKIEKIPNFPPGFVSFQLKEEKKKSKKNMKKSYTKN